MHWFKPLKRLGEFRGGTINPRALKHSPIVFWVGRERVATNSRIFIFKLRLIKLINVSLRTQKKIREFVATSSCSFFPTHCLLIPLQSYEKIDSGFNPNT